MSERAPGFMKHPDYRVDVSPTDDHIRILHGDRCIADSRRPLKVTESRHQPVWYLPLSDVDPSVIEATDHTSYCPFKGHASYWSVTAGSSRLENSIWGYLSPYRECELLSEHVGFYVDLFTLEVNGERLNSPGPGWIE
jgi:uncharacterized protein (DUF427 family)